MRTGSVHRYQWIHDAGMSSTDAYPPSSGLEGVIFEYFHVKWITPPTASGEDGGGYSYFGCIASRDIPKARCRQIKTKSKFQVLK